MENKLPEGWEWKKLGEISKIKAGGTPSRGKMEYWNDGTIPWVKITDMKEKYVSGTSEFITEAGLKNSSAKIIPKGTILISIFASIGQVGILDIDATCNQAIAGVQICDKNVDKIYLYYYLISKKDYFLNIGRGVAQNNINQKILKETEILVPPLETQQKIVSILEKAEETKKLRAQADELTQKLLQSVFLEMFGDTETNPNNWDLVTLEKVCEEIYRYPTFYGFEYVPNGIPVLKISNMDKNGGFLEDLNIYDKITEDINKKYPRTIVDEGDIIFEARGTYIGKCALVPPILKGSNISPNTVRISPKRDTILPEYLIHLSFSKGWKTKIESRVNYWKGGFGTIKTSDLKVIKIPLPPIHLQHRFVQIVRSIKSTQQSQNQSSVEINNLFDALMQKAFTGKLIS